MSEQGNAALKIAPVVLIKAPMLMFSLGVSYLRVKRRANKTAKDFKRSLRQEGLPADLVRKLTRDYADNTRLITRFASSAMNGQFPFPR